MENQSRTNTQWSKRGEFCELLLELMKQQNVSGEKLCEGVCSDSMLSRVKQGERYFNKMMRDRLMARLGISDERNENFLDSEDYVKWKARRDILKSVDRKEIKKAQKLLAEYAQSEDFVNAIEQQFYQAMEIQLMMYEKTSDKKLPDGNEEEGSKDLSGGAEQVSSQGLADKLEYALKLTVPSIDEKKICDLQLSLQELNLILEYEKYRHPDRLVERCDEILQYINDSAMDDESKAKIYPKVAWYQCEALSKEEDADYQKIWEHSNQGIEYLRSTQKMYYLWELLVVRENILEERLGLFSVTESNKKAEELVRMRQETGEWKQAIEDVYERCGTAPQMDNFCYLYKQQEIYCINDVIRCRRKMLGMTRMQLGEDICDHKTIARMEKENTKTQMPVVKKLFERLNLSGELQRMDIATGSTKALELLNELVKYANNFDLENEKKTLQELETYLNMDIPLNRQFVKKEQAIQLRTEDRYSKENNERVLQMMLEALECTISFEKIQKSDILYLTGGEMSCLYHMAFCMSYDKMNPYFEILQRLCKQYEQKDEVEEHISKYEWFMMAIANILGNMGEYDISDALAEKVMLQSIRCRRLGIITRYLNRILTNNDQRRMKNILRPRDLDERKMLQTCISVCQFVKDAHSEEYYRRKWKS